MDKVRLQKYIAHSGVASRRKAEELIKQGKVEVNGRIVSEPWLMIGNEDSVKVNGKVVSIEKNLIYIMLNKPLGYVTTVKDQFHRKTVLDLVVHVNERIYPVGRLDYDTSGLILLTNDGDFAYKLTHPSHEIKKVYIAEVNGIPDKDDIRKFVGGLEIGSYKTWPAEVCIQEKGKDRSTLAITIHEGRNRQVKKMCEAIGHPVIKLKRIAIGKVNLGSLSEGKWRHLTKEEVESFS
ncbi:MAG TPA: pseudouridine synthase [Clostridiales bacterium]|nr:pseudouridine synthase [Clostridiales bacterium]